MSVYGGLLDTLDVFGRCGILSEQEATMLSMDLLIEETMLLRDDLAKTFPELADNVKGDIK